jgi:putative endonuclease
MGLQCGISRTAPSCRSRSAWRNATSPTNVCPSCGANRPKRRRFRLANTRTVRPTAEYFPVSNHRAEIGAAAEREAAAALVSAGWQILARNLRVAGLEIDILARDETGRLVAVEVRARLRVGEATPTEILGQRKRAALRRQREAFASCGGWPSGGRGGRRVVGSPGTQLGALDLGQGIRTRSMSPRNGGPSGSRWRPAVA